MHKKERLSQVALLIWISNISLIMGKNEKSDLSQETLP